ncbi:hypothetical protein [Micromonospora profundi]|uniref:hypothetical protein n=1 Tax=Micromonospora TaxID=1873 RepID=UPI0033B7C09F
MAWLGGGPTRRPESEYALFRQFGAKPPDDLTGGAVLNGPNYGSRAGYDNGYALTANLPAAAAATTTGNLIFFPKVNVLVVYQKAFVALPADLHVVLTDATTRTRTRTR